MRSSLEALFAAQLKAAGLVFKSEVPFAEHVGRKWRADFQVWAGAIDHLPDYSRVRPEPIMVEINGGTWINGRHNTGAGSERDMEKASYAAALGWRVLQLTAKMVEDGTGLALVEAALGLRAVPVKAKKPRRKKVKG